MLRPVNTAAHPPRLAFYGDDLTGATDTLAILAEAGLRTRLFLRVPDGAALQAAGTLDVIGIAGAARSLSPAAMRDELGPVAAFFARCGAPALLYKVCSTWDSAPHVGSIGEALRVLSAPLGGRPVLLVGGQPALGRFCAFGQVFASSSPGGPVERLDRHPTMRRHPVTPMAEADLRRHLAAQGVGRIGLFDLRDHELAPDAQSQRLATLLSDRPDAVLLDATREAQMATIGRLWGSLGTPHAPQLAIGAGGAAQALVDHWGLPRQALRPAVAPARGPVLALAGSLSPLTARQVAQAASYQPVPLDAAALAQGDESAFTRAEQALLAALRDGRHALAVTRAGDTTPAHLAALAPACGRLLRRVLQQQRVARVGVAGGDTSSLAMQALAPRALDWAGRLAPGVALCRAVADAPWLDGVELMLKGGQMGPESLFEDLVRGTG
jgi:uncharacterized protein YgbK (DUF1537 family)